MLWRLIEFIFIAFGVIFFFVLLHEGTHYGLNNGATGFCIGRCTAIDEECNTHHVFAFIYADKINNEIAKNEGVVSSISFGAVGLIVWLFARRYYFEAKKQAGEEKE